MSYNIKGSRCLVTGGAGLIGSTIVDKLFERGAKTVDIIDDFSEGRNENLKETYTVIYPRTNTLIVGDLSDRKFSNKVISGYDYVFHCAGHLLLKTQAEPYEALDANVKASYNVFEAALNTKVKKLVFTSSISIFGEPEYTPVDENHPLNNTTIYGATKICGEHMLRDFGRRGLKYSVIRPYNVYGPRQSPKNGAYSQVVPKWIKCILEDEPIIIFGDGSQTMDLVHVEDMAEAHVLALEKEEADGACFNIGTGISTSASTLAELLRLYMDKPNHPIQYIPQDVNIVKNRRCDITKAQNVLGYTPKWDVPNGLKHTIEWWRENG